MALIDRIAKISPLAIPAPGSGNLPGLEVKPFVETGVTGLLRTKGTGIVYDEWLRDLSSYRQKQIYREMRDNDPVIGAMFFALEMILRRAEWKVEAAPKSGAKGEKYAQFVQECMTDMSHSWEDFISEAVNMFAFGFSLFEVPYKRRMGQDPGSDVIDGESFERPTSRFDDGLIGWRKFAPRSQESIVYWMWDKQGGLQGAVQLAAPDFQTVPLPIGKLLLFRTTSIKNNPEGRPLALDTPIPTPYGWTTIQNIEIGERVFDETGVVRTVTGKSEIFIDRPAYEIGFSSGGKITADADHLWQVTTHNDRFNEKPPRDLTTRELYDALQKGTPNHFCCGQAPILEGCPKLDLPLDPYFLGYWLGNGRSTSSVLSCHEDDAEELSSLINVVGYTTEIHGGNWKDRVRTVSVHGKKKWDHVGPCATLRRLGLFNNKHVPVEYLRASIDQRLSLLQGLMDSDGYSPPEASKDEGSTFCNTNRALTSAVCELVRSLGGQPRIRLMEKAGTIAGTIKGKPIISRMDSFSVRFMLDLPVHRLVRKLNRQTFRKTIRNSGHFIRSIVPVENVSTACIEVDSPSHLFLAGESMVPTHNSVLRNCFVPWFRKRRIEEVEGIGIERDACGIPVLSITKEALAGMQGGEAAARRLVRNIRVDDQMGVVLPLTYDDKGNPGVKLELLRAAGSKQVKASETIRRYNQDILNTLLAGFIQFGQTPTGSKALHISATGIFSEAVAAFMDSAAGVVNRIEIPRLMKYNRMDLSMAPRIVPGDIGGKDMEAIANFVQKLSMAGLTFFDKPTTNYLRKVADLPEAPDEPNLPTGNPNEVPDTKEKVPEPGAPPVGLERSNVARAQQATAAAGAGKDSGDEVTE